MPVVCGARQILDLACKLYSVTSFLLSDEHAVISFYMGIPTLWPTIRMVAARAGDEESIEAGDKAAAYFMLGVVAGWAAAGIFDLVEVRRGLPGGEESGQTAR